MAFTPLLFQTIVHLGPTHVRDQVTVTVTHHRFFCQTEFVSEYKHLCTMALFVDYTMNIRSIKSFCSPLLPPYLRPWISECICLLCWFKGLNRHITFTPHSAASAMSTVQRYIEPDIPNNFLCVSWSLHQFSSKRWRSPLLSNVVRWNSISSVLSCQFNNWW